MRRDQDRLLDVVEAARAIGRFIAGHDASTFAADDLVRHAYFTGADEPYDRLKRALRAEIDEAAWSQLYSTTSRHFDPPDTGNRRQSHQPLRR